MGREELRDERHLRHDGEGQNAAREGLGEDDQGVVALAPPFAYDWLGSKGRDTFSPIGPGITPAWFVGDPQDLAVRLWRNSELEQDGNTRNMIFSIPRLISAASAMMTLEPGDVIATGTPAGVGVAQGTSLADADFLRIEIDGLGVLENPVRVEPVVLRNHLMAATPRRVS